MSAAFTRAGEATQYNPHRPLDWAFEQDVGSSVGKMILCIICRLGNKTRLCFASIPKIAASANCQEASVRKWLKEFLKRGWLKERGSSARATRTFEIIFDGAETATCGLVGTGLSTVESVTQNPENPKSEQCRRSTQRLRHRPVIPSDASIAEVLKLYRAPHCDSG